MPRAAWGAWLFCRLCPAPPPGGCPRPHSLSCSPVTFPGRPHAAGPGEGRLPGRQQALEEEAKESMWPGREGGGRTGGPWRALAAGRARRHSRSCGRSARAPVRVGGRGCSARRARSSSTHARGQGRGQFSQMGAHCFSPQGPSGAGVLRPESQTQSVAPAMAPQPWQLGREVRATLTPTGCPPARRGLAGRGFLRAQQRLSTVLDSRSRMSLVRTLGGCSVVLGAGHLEALGRAGSCGALARGWGVSAHYRRPQPGGLG